jgi:hypothetical protein
VSGVGVRWSWCRLRLLAGADQETGYRDDTLEKVVPLEELVGEVARHPPLGSVLALTVLYLVAAG